MLWGTWWFFGIEPPVAANTLSLLCGLATLVLGYRMLQRIALPQGLERVRGLLTGLVLSSVATQRLFLTWLSSGLETGLFVLCLTWWVAEAARAAALRDPWWPARLSASAVLTALTRPDGLLLWAATFLLAWNARAWRPRDLAQWLLLLAVPAHVLWRLATYGEWLPNTYYAKHVAAWPESGARYLACFVIENGTWAWLLLAGAVAARRAFRTRTHAWSDASRGLIVVGTLLAHVAYYTLIIGGDHFEYRVFAHFALLLPIATVWLAARLASRLVVVLPVTVLCLAAPHPIAWLHYVRAEPLAPCVPSAFRPVMAAFDTWQTWLTQRSVCERHSIHREFCARSSRLLPKREAGQAISFDDRPVLLGFSVGIISWALPNVAIIDVLGLNDWVAARTPMNRPAGLTDALPKLFRHFDLDNDGRLPKSEVLIALASLPPEQAAGAARLLERDYDFDLDGVVTREEVEHYAIFYQERHMAHDRMAPDDYIVGFRPNVRVVEQRVIVTPRDPPLTDADIVRHETAFRARLRH